MGLSDCPVAVAPLHHREGNAGIGMEMGYFSELRTQVELGGVHGCYECGY